MPEYKYNGYTIRQVIRPTLADRNSAAWDVFGEGGFVKRNFDTLEVARHYIDACLKPKVQQYIQTDLFAEVAL